VTLQAATDKATRGRERNKRRICNLQQATRKNLGVRSRTNRSP
jgi:hypothetical protein